MSTSPASRGLASPLDAFAPRASGPADLLAYVPYCLRQWPRESLVLVLATPAALGPCLRLDLPDAAADLPVWSRPLRTCLQQLAASGNWSQVFVSAWTGHTLPDPEEAEAFRVPLAVVLALQEAMGLSGHHDLPAPDPWVVDDIHDRWGQTRWGQTGWGQVRALGSSAETMAPGSTHRLPGPGVEEAGWAVPREGTREDLLCSPLAAALVVGGQGIGPGPTGLGTPVQGGGDARRPGPEDALHGPTRPAPDWRQLVPAPFLPVWERRLARAASAEDADPSTDRCPEQVDVLDGLVQRLGPLMQDAAGHLKADADSGCLPTVRELTALRGLLGTCTGCVALMVLAARGRIPARRFLAGMGVGATAGDVAGRPALEAAVEEAMDLMAGRAVTAPDARGLRVLSLLLAAMAEETGAPTAVSSAAEAGLAFLGWFRGCSSRTHEHLARSVSERSAPLRELLARAGSVRPLPRWLTEASSTLGW